MSKPVTLSCGHSRCQACFAQLLAIENALKFSLCQDSIPSRVTSKYQVNCTNLGCKWFGALGCTKVHSKTCDKAQVECTNGCKYVAERERTDGRPCSALSVRANPLHSLWTSHGKGLLGAVYTRFPIFLAVGLPCEPSYKNNLWGKKFRELDVFAELGRKL